MLVIHPLRYRARDVLRVWRRYRASSLRRGRDAHGRVQSPWQGGRGGDRDRSASALSPIPHCLYRTAVGQSGSSRVPPLPRWPVQLCGPCSSSSELDFLAGQRPPSSSPTPSTSSRNGVCSCARAHACVVSDRSLRSSCAACALSLVPVLGAVVVPAPTCARSGAACCAASTGKSAGTAVLRSTALLRLS